MNVFDIIPSDFCNCLAGKSNNRVYVDCLELIHNQYDKEISYRLERSYLRGVLAAFLLENHLDLSDEENTANAGNDEANFVLRKFISVGWLEEDQDETTFEKYIVMSDNGITLVSELEKYSDFTKTLEENDISKANVLIDKGCHKEIMEYMLKHNQKLEQEIISWKEEVNKNIPEKLCEYIVNVLSEVDWDKE